MEFKAETRLRVRYAETDQMGIVYHSNYLIWFEVGRTELFRELKLPYTMFEEQGLGLTVIEACCNYRKPARYDDDIIVSTNVKISSRKVTFSYLIYRETTLLAEGKTIHLFVNKQGRAVDAHSHPLWQQIKEIIEEHTREDTDSTLEYRGS
ncbi:MAG: acyl-CoA thioesterase [Desulfitobacteriaceae bacterium]